MTKRSKRIYTEDDRERARVALEMHDGNVSAASKESGIPRVTLLGWKNEWEIEAAEAAALPVPKEVLSTAVEHIRQTEKSLVIEAAWAAARAGFARAIEALPEATAQQAATVAGIAVDKAQLLSGAATERHEHDIRAILATLPGGVRQTIVSLVGDDLRQEDNTQDSR